MWVGIDGEMIYQRYPGGTFNPLNDAGMRYQHEAVLETAAIDLGAARLPKFFKDFTAITENLTTGVEVHLEYQLDGEIGSGNWLRAEAFYRSPEDTLPIGAGAARRIRLRLRLLTNQAHVPPVVQATVLEGYARTPLKYQWNLRLKIADSQRDLSGGRQDHQPDELIAWLKAAAVNARRVTMRSIWAQLDGKTVIVEPPTLLREFSSHLQGQWGGSLIVTVREA